MCLACSKQTSLSARQANRVNCAACYRALSGVGFSNSAELLHVVTTTADGIDGNTGKTAQFLQRVVSPGLHGAQDYLRLFAELSGVAQIVISRKA